MGTRTLLDRLDAALASCAARLWSELLEALAVAGQAAAGVRCFPPDPPGADERSVGLDRTFREGGERATSFGLPADTATRAMAASGNRTVSAEEVARVLPDGQGPPPKSAGRRCSDTASLGREVAAGGVSNGAAHWGPGLSKDEEAGVVPSDAHSPVTGGRRP